MREKKKKKKKRKLKVRNFCRLLLCIGLIVAFVMFILNIKITQIEIVGTNLITDTEIIEIAGIKNYPAIFQIPTITLKNRIKKLDLVNDVKISKNLYGKLSIKIDEAVVLFYNKTNDKYVLSNGKEIDFNQDFLSIPTLINHVPSDIYNNLVKGLKEVNTDVRNMISEIEYSPSKTLDGQNIDETRFLLRMNDSNTVYMNTINIKQLNNYLNITSAILASVEEKYGILYLDSSTEENFSFESYASIQRAKEEEEKQKEEEKEAEKDDKKDDKKESTKPTTNKKRSQS